MTGRLRRWLLRLWLGLSVLWVGVATVASALRWWEIRRYVRPEHLPELLRATAVDILVPVGVGGLVVGVLLVLLRLIRVSGHLLRRGARADHRPGSGAVPRG